MSQDPAGYQSNVQSFKSDGTPKEDQSPMTEPLAMNGSGPLSKDYTNSEGNAYPGVVRKDNPTDKSIGD